MYSNMLFACVLAVLAGLSGCASQKAIEVPPENLSMVAMSDLGEGNIGEHFLWGGVIIETRNLDAGTRLEVLGYPLDARQRPRTRQAPIGRFLIRSDDYLEAIDFAEGREVTVYGEYTETLQGVIGETSYEFPVLNAESLHLWSREQRQVRPYFSIGVGVEL